MDPLYICLYYLFWSWFLSKVCWFLVIPCLVVFVDYWLLCIKWYKDNETLDEIISLSRGFTFLLESNYDRKQFLIRVQG